MRDQDFEEILDAAKRGGEWARDWIYREFRPNVLAALNGKQAGRQDQQDLLNSVFLRFFRALEAGKVNSRTRPEIGAWLAKAARRLASSQKTAARNEKPHIPVFSDPEDIHLLENGLSSAPSFEHDLIRRDILHKVVLQVRRALCERDFQWWCLRNVEGLSHQEIAEIWGCPASSVRATLSRHRKKISRAIEHLVKGKPK